MPFAILYTVIIGYLTENKIDIAIVTLFSLARLPYSLKFLWSPLIDYYSVPLIAKFIPGKRGWMLLAVIIIFLSLMMIAKSDCSNISALMIWSVIIGIAGATYDIAFDALRIQMLDQKEQGTGIAIVSTCYKIGSIAVNVGSLMVAHQYGWQSAFYALATTLFICSLSVLLCKINVQQKKQDSTFTKSTIRSFQDIIRRPNAILVIATIMVYKCGDAMLSFAGMPFYLKLGFTKAEIAVVVKTYGAVATILGTYVGAYLFKKLSPLRCLMFCGIAQMSTNLLYIWMNVAGNNYDVFVIANFTENFTGGMGASALVAYISCLCNTKYACTHYAVFSSIATFANNTITSLDGLLIKYIGWNCFFVLTALISVPALFMIKRIESKAN